MKTLRYVNNKHINESTNVFSDDLYNQSLIYAIGRMDDGEVKHALYVMDAYSTSFDQCIEYDRFMNGIDDWCELHDIPFELWDEKSNYDREAAFFKAYGLVYDRNGERIIESEESINNSESLRKDCYNIAYNMYLSKEAGRMNKQSLAKLSMSFNEGFNGVQLESIVDIPSKPVFGKANKMGQVARQLGDTGKFMHYLELEYDLV